MRQRSYNSSFRIATSHFLKKPENCSRCSYQYHTSSFVARPSETLEILMGFRSLRTMNCAKAAAIFSVVSFGFCNILSDIFMSLPRLCPIIYMQKEFLKVFVPFRHNHLSKAHKVKSDVKLSKCLQQYLKSSYTSVKPFIQTQNANTFYMRLEPAKLYLLHGPSCQNIANASCLLRVYFCLVDK